MGPPDCGKTFLLKGLRDVYSTYERPDGGSYQLENLLGKEVVFLNDFEYDVQAKDRRIAFRIARLWLAGLGHHFW